jgi:hypothetical protein
MSHDKSKKIMFCGEPCNIFLYNHVFYDIHFPYQWLDDMMPGTGPNECAECQKHGFLNDVFVGFCESCAVYIYEYTRGHGFYDGIEIISEKYKDTSAAETYLKYIDHKKIGYVDNRLFRKSFLLIS